MLITTRYEVKVKKVTNPWGGGPSLDEGDAQLIVYVSINGKESHNFVALSGPEADIEEFVRGEIDETEIQRRWFKRTSF